MQCPPKVSDLTVFPLVTPLPFTFLTEGYDYKTPSLVLDLVAIHVTPIPYRLYLYTEREKWRERNIY